MCFMLLMSQNEPLQLPGDLSIAWTVSPETVSQNKSLACHSCCQAVRRAVDMALLPALPRHPLFLAHSLLGSFVGCSPDDDHHSIVPGSSCRVTPPLCVSVTCMSQVSRTYTGDQVPMSLLETEDCRAASSPGSAMLKLCVHACACVWREGVAHVCGFMYVYTNVEARDQLLASSSVTFTLSFLRQCLSRFHELDSMSGWPPSLNIFPSPPL